MKHLIEKGVIVFFILRIFTTLKILVPMITRLVFISTVLLVLTSCNSIKLNSKTYQRSANDNPTLLGSIGTLKNNLNVFEANFNTSENFNSLSLPYYTSKVPVSIHKIEPTTKDYIKLKNTLLGLKKIDSTKPQKRLFILNIQIIDKVKVIENLNNSQNNEITKFLEATPKASIVTSIVIQVSPEIYNGIKSNEVYFLKSNSRGLAILENSVTQKNHFISKFKVLAYQSENFCWGANKKRKIELVSIVSKTCDCPKKTSHKAYKIKKKLAYEF